jgi:hypothetical protein
MKVTNYVGSLELSTPKEFHGVGMMVEFRIIDVLGAWTEFIPFIKNCHNLITSGLAEIP